MKIAYFVHNVDDAAVSKRMTMLAQSGAEARLIGFRRFAVAGDKAEQTSTIVIGRSNDGQFLQRILVILSCLLWPFGLVKAVKESDAVLCRNLEMLVLGYGIRALSGSKAPLSYECLDIHGKLLGDSRSARLLRRVELFLMNQCQTVITSSPGFIRNYFQAIQNFTGPIYLLENKVLKTAGTKGVVQSITQAPWTIGWFGIIRCRKSLQMLDSLTRRLPSIKVVISGRVAHQAFDDFDGTIEANPSLSYTGPFKPEELAEVYGRAHFVWAIDYYEEGENSTWLLPNRLYDSLAFGAVPIALRQVETGHWLQAREAGVVVNAPLEDLLQMFETLTEDDYLILKQMTKAIMPTDIFHDRASIGSLINAVGPVTVLAPT